MVARNNRKLPIKKKDAKRMAATPKANISAYGKKSVVKKMNKAHTEKVRPNIEKKLLERTQRYNVIDTNF